MHWFSIISHWVLFKQVEVLLTDPSENSYPSEQIYVKTLPTVVLIGSSIQALWILPIGEGHLLAVRQKRWIRISLIFITTENYFFIFNDFILSTYICNQDCENSNYHPVDKI